MKSNRFITLICTALLIAASGLGHVHAAIDIYGDGFENIPKVSANVVLQGALQQTALTVEPLQTPGATPVSTGATDAQGRTTLLLPESRSFRVVIARGGTDAARGANQGNLRVVIPPSNTPSAINISPLTDISWRMVKDLPERFSPADIQKILDDTALIMLKVDLNADGKLNYLDVLAFDPSNAQHTGAVRFGYELIAAAAQSGDPSIIDSYLAGDEAALTSNIERALRGILNFSTPEENATQAKIGVGVFGQGKVIASDNTLSADIDGAS